MQCEVCRKKVRTNKNIFNLFSVETHHICEYCYQRYPLLMRLDVLPIEEGVLIQHLLSSRYYSIHPTAFMSFLKPYYMDFIKHHQGKTFILFDILDNHTLAMLDSLRFGDIYFVSLYENIEKKGEKL